MSLLSTLRPLPQRLLERLWLILSGYVPISIEYHMTMNALNDDCLLILLDTLSMSQLFQLRGVSRRLCHLIEGQSLLKFKTITFTYDDKKNKNLTGKGTIQLYIASRKDAYKEFGMEPLFFWHWKPHNLPASKRVSLRSSAWPLSLPLLLPRLSCLTLEHFLVDQVEAPTKELLAINRRFVSYLNSNWSRTLTTLHLNIHVSPKPEPDNSFFAQLNQLITLHHLFIEFSGSLKPEISPFLLPDSMPVFGQLFSFALRSYLLYQGFYYVLMALRSYGGSNSVTLLHQLSHHLSFLSLDEINCPEDDLVAFLRARPNYARTLKTIDVNWHTTSWSLFTEVTQNLTSVEDFSFSSFNAPRTDLNSIFSDLSNLPLLKSIHWVPLFVAQLRVLQLRQHWPGILPRLTSIRSAAIVIYTRGENGNPFQSSELFDQLLPLVFRVFCSLEKLTIHFFEGHSKRRDEALSEQLITKVGELSPTLKLLDAIYFV